MAFGPSRCHGALWLAFEHPRRALLGVFTSGTDQGGSAIAGERHCVAEARRAAVAPACELCALLRPRRARACEDPRRAGGAAFAADERGFAVRGQRHAVAEFAFAALSAAGEPYSPMDERVESW